MVKKKVNEIAFQALKQECREKKKTENIVYKSLRPQDYLTYLYPKEAHIIFKSRAKTLPIKDHQSFRYSDKSCRRCNQDEETLQHIVNCQEECEIDIAILYKMDDESSSDEMKTKIKLLAKRINKFIEEFK